MSNQSCFGEPWVIPNFDSIYRIHYEIQRRPEETLFLKDDGGSVGVKMVFNPLWGNEGHFSIDVTLKFHDTPVNNDITIDFFVVCGDSYHDIKSTLAGESEVDENCSTMVYECYKENLTTDSSLTPNDTLTIAVRYSISPALIQVPIQKTTNLDWNPIVDLERLFEDDKFADFMFSVRGVEFKVHKAIVAIRSAVFEAMMQHDMKEKSENRAEISDVDPAAFKEMLRYIYTGKVENLATVVDGLIMVADKYGLRGLKDICEDYLSEGLCPENAIELLKKADVWSCERLKAQTLKYIFQNITRVSDTDAWKNLASCLPAKLISEICYFSASKEKISLRVSSQSKKRKRPSDSHKNFFE